MDGKGKEILGYFCIMLQSICDGFSPTKYETLTGDEVRDIILKGKKPNRPITNKDGGARGDRSVLSAKSSSSSSSRSKFPGLSGKVAGSRRDATEA